MLHGDANDLRAQARDLFLKALDESDPDRRERLIRSACGSDAALHLRVEALLREHDTSDRFMAADALGVPTAAAPEEQTTIGTVIGRYQLAEKIGEGGMGIVYRAEQDAPIRRQVALKVIKLGMGSRQVLARFEAERRALALMDHPNIARVLDGGATDSGRPYFVMELVPGVPITEFCTRNNVSLQQRLHLFAVVCQAVQHAHQKGIIHRDLKPSNILITLNDGTPVPKVIDFGVAKATNQRHAEKTLFTHHGTIIGTPAYMSPEQADGSSADIDTRSDIYSLGVLLYELLAGSPPFPEERLRSVAYREMQRIILHEDPERPSTRLRKTATGSSSPPLAPRRSSLDSDLDWIVLKCLEKDRNRRYETANGLASDLRRVLAHEPVSARPPSAGYRLGKLIRRNRAASFAIVFVTLATVLGATISTWALFRERAARADERIALERASAHARFATGFIREVFDKIVPELARLTGASVTRDALIQAGVGFAGDLRNLSVDDPELRTTLARMLIHAAESQDPGFANTTGRYERGLTNAETALELIRIQPPTLGVLDYTRLLYRARLAEIQCFWALGRWSEGIQRQSGLDPLLDVLESDPALVAWVREQRINNRLGLGAALASAGEARKAIDDYLRPFLSSDWASNIRDDSPETHLRYRICAYDNLAWAQALLGENDTMLPSAREAARLAEVLVRRFPENVRYVAGLPYSRSVLGLALARHAHTAEGLALQTESIAAIDRKLAQDPANDLFRYHRAIVVALHAMTHAVASREIGIDIAERARRLGASERLLTEAEVQARESGAKVVDEFLGGARREIAHARKLLEAERPRSSQP